MSITVVVVSLNILAALSALAAACFWYRSATIRLLYEDEPGPNGIYPAAIITSDNTDFFRTDEVRSSQSRRGAYAAAIASSFQFLALLLQSVALSS